MPRTNSKIPDRWEAYSKIGKVILGTKIVPIKTPLRESLTSSLPPEERFSPSSLIHLLQKENLKLGGVIDLTNTTRYYDKQFFEDNGVGYRKIFTAGRVIPDNNTYHQFASAIKELEKEGELTCVHCTHGLNRSGYLICRYMIQVLNMEPQKAIQLFEDARGYKMERPNYIDDLMARKPGESGSIHLPSSHGSSVSHSGENNFGYISQHNYNSDHQERMDYRQQRGNRSDNRSWNHHSRQRGGGGGGYSRSQNSFNTWNRDGLQWNQGGASGNRPNAVDHHRLGGAGSQGRGRSDGRSYGNHWETGSSRDNCYNGGYQQRGWNGGGGGSYRQRQGQSSSGKWQSNDYSYDSNRWNQNPYNGRGGYGK